MSSRTLTCSTLEIMRMSSTVFIPLCWFLFSCLNSELLALVALAHTHTHLHNKRIKTNIRVAWTYQHQKKTATTTFFIHWHWKKWAKVNKTNVNGITWSEWGYRRDGIISEKCSRKWNLTFKLVFPYYLLVVKRIIIFLCAKVIFFLLSSFKLFHFVKCMWNSNVMLDFDVDDRKPSCFSLFNFEPFALLSLLTHSLVVFPTFHLNNVFIF